MPYPSTYPTVYPAEDAGGGGTPQSGYDPVGIGYDDIRFTYDGSDATSAPPPPPPTPPPPTEAPTGDIGSVPFSTSRLYVVATYTRSGRRVAVLPAINLQFEFLLNEPGNFRFDLPIQHPAVTRENIEELVHEVWVYRKGTLIYAGPIWNISTNSDGSSLSVESQGLLSYFRFRIITQTMQWHPNNTGPGIATYLVLWTQARPFGDLRITVPDGYGDVDALNGLPLGYWAGTKWYEQKNVYDKIKDLADDATTGFDYEVTPERIFIPYQTEKGNTRPGLLRYPTHFRNYYFPRYGSQVSNNFDLIGPGDGVATLVGRASNTNSMKKYGLMEGTGSWPDAKTTKQLNSRAAKWVKEHAAPISVPTPVLRGDAGPFLGTYRPGDRVRLQIDNGYDQVDRIERMTGFQLTPGANDEETISVYFNTDDEAQVG